MQLLLCITTCHMLSKIRQKQSSRYLLSGTVTFCVVHLPQVSGRSKLERSLSNPSANRQPPSGGGGSAQVLPDLVLRYVVIVLQALMHCGLLQARQTWAQPLQL